MGIVVQHQPPLTALSELAFQTGQLQYRNQRRRELEAQQLAQAQMAQKERLAQMQVMANTQSQMRGHQQGMQRLAYQNMMGQQSQVGQHQLQMIQNAERAKQQRELANIYGENNVQAANVASENRMFERQQAAIKDMYDNVLNQQGQEALHGLLGQQQELKMSPDISPEEKQQQMEQIGQQIFQLREDPAMTLGRDEKPGHVRGKGDIYEEVRQADGTYIPRVRTTRPAVQPDGSIAPENIPIEEIRAKTDKVEPIEGTDEVRVSRYNEATGLVDVTTHKSNKLTPEQMVKQQDAQQSAVKQVTDAYQAMKDARDALVSQSPPNVDIPELMPMSDWLNSKEGVIHKQVLKNSGIDVDALMREWEVSNTPVGAGLIPLEGLLNQQPQQDQQAQQPQQQEMMEHPTKGEIDIKQWEKTDEQGRPRPIPFVHPKSGKAYKSNSHPTLGADNEEEYASATISFEQNVAEFFLDDVHDDMAFNRRDKLGSNYQLGTVWDYKDLEGNISSFVITPALIHNAILRSTENVDRANEVRDRALADYEIYYGVPFPNPQ